MLLLREVYSNRKLNKYNLINWLRIVLFSHWTVASQISDGCFLLITLITFRDEKNRELLNTANSGSLMRKRSPSIPLVSLESGHLIWYALRIFTVKIWQSRGGWTSLGKINFTLGSYLQEILPRNNFKSTSCLLKNIHVLSKTLYE